MVWPSGEWVCWSRLIGFEGSNRGLAWYGMVSYETKLLLSKEKVWYSGWVWYGNLRYGTVQHWIEYGMKKHAEGAFKRCCTGCCE